ncbi:CoA transferase [Nesterenkonia populi]|uniref:CoA transferase n=1 Tax=Nesterenkonia populi TaxID=1591087 RepID=UPI0024824388|nr:CoA transferase [Nesterenkonia populi]
MSQASSQLYAGVGDHLPAGIPSGPLNGLVADVLSQHSAERWFEALQEVEVPCAPILTIGEGIRFPERLGLRPVVTAGEEPEAVPTIKHPVQFSRTPARYTKAPPPLGADNAEIRSWLRQRCSADMTQEAA